MKQSFFSLILLILFMATTNCFGRSQKATPSIPTTNFFSEEQLVSLEHISASWDVDLGIPWGFDFLPSSKEKKSDSQTLPNLIVSSRGGQLYMLSLASGQKTLIKGLPATVEVGQGGLMDVRLHPQFAQNKWIFFSYVASYQRGQGTVVAKAQLHGLELKNLKVLFRSSPPGRGGRHFGCRIVFKDNAIFFAIGDRGDRHKAQDLSYPNGKVFRLYEDGTVPEDNPFVGRTLKSKRKVLEAIWSYGHRNPQGLVIHPHTSELWEQEHGPRGGDEINLIEKGKNYGWPVITYGKEYWGPSIGTTHKKGMQQPIKYYVPSIAPSSLMIYSGRLFSKWKGDFFSTALRDPHISRVVIQKTHSRSNPQVLKEEKLLSGFRHRIRHIREDLRTGIIYFSTDSGHFYRLTK